MTSNTVYLIRCDQCGDAKVPPGDIQLVIEDHGGSWWQYVHCGQIHRQSANPRTVTILLASGVPHVDMAYENAHLDEDIRYMLATTCRVCGGQLVGKEVGYGTCGHCGGRR